MEPTDILREDFAQTLAFIDKCDAHIFKVKNWALISVSAVIAFSISQDELVYSLANLVLLGAFMYLELIYKSFQDVAIDHCSDISARLDKHLEDPCIGTLLAGYKHSFGRRLKYPSVTRVFSNLLQEKHWHVVSFYLLLAAFSVAAYLVVPVVT